jgi:hypothetical protein
LIRADYAPVFRLSLPVGGFGKPQTSTYQKTVSYGGNLTSDWPDGQDHPDDWHSSATECLSDGAMHTHNKSTAAGTALAISYTSDMREVTVRVQTAPRRKSAHHGQMSNLVVFSVLANTPFKRIAEFSVPKDLPPCPDGGCTCTHMWVPGSELCFRLHDAS